MSFDPNTVNADAATANPTAGFNLQAARWDELLAWLGSSREVPEIDGQIAAWRAFKKEWEDAGFAAPTWPELTIWREKPVDKLAGQASNLAVAESNAASHGYVVAKMRLDGETASRDVSEMGKPTGRFSPPPTSPRVAAKDGPKIVVAPSATPSMEAKHPVATAVDAAAPKIEDPTDDPDFAPKAAIVGGLALGTIAATIAAKSESGKMLVAAGGTFATVAAAYLAFKDTTKDGKKKPEKKR